MDFGTLWHTAYPYCGITGMARVNYHKGEPNLYSFKTSFVLFYHCFLMASHVTEPNMALSAARTPCSLTPTPIPLRKKGKLLFYILKTNQYILSRLMIHSIKVSFLIVMYVLTVYLI